MFKSSFIFNVLGKLKSSEMEFSISERVSSSLINYHNNCYHRFAYLLSSRLYCRLRNLTESCLSARGLYRR